MIDKTLDGLRAARARIATPHSWTKDAYARDENGTAVSAEDESAVCFCTSGAHMRVHPHRDGFLDACVLLNNAAYAVSRGAHLGRISFNDAPETTHADVLAMFDHAIEARRAELKAAA